MIGSRTGHFLSTRQKYSCVSPLAGRCDRDTAGLKEGRCGVGERKISRRREKEGRNKRNKEKREFQSNVIVLLTSGGGYMYCTYIHNTRTLSEKAF